MLDEQYASLWFDHCLECSNRVQVVHIYAPLFTISWKVTTGLAESNGSLVL